MFTANESRYNAVFKAIERLAKYVNQKDPYAFLRVLNTGVSAFDNPDPLHSFEGDQAELLDKYDLDDFSIAKYIYHGKPGRDWYSKTLKTFKSQLNGCDIELFVKLFAITSPRTNFASNIRNALKAYDLYINKKSFTNNGFMRGIVTILDDFRSGTFTFDETPRGGRRKIVNFAKAILGDKDAVVVDSWLLKALGLAQLYIHKNGQGGTYNPRRSEYDLAERYIRALAISSGYEARQIIGMVWHGVRTSNSHLKVTDTAQVLNKIRESVKVVR